MDYSGHENRRQHPRVREDLKVKITSMDPPDNRPPTEQPIECHTKDISFQGMCIISHVRIEPGSKLQLQVQVKDPLASFSFSGIVIWCNYNSTTGVYEIGIQLFDVDNFPVDWKRLVIDLIAKS